MPRWVKVSGFTVAVLVLLVIIGVLTGVLRGPGGGGHGPGLHAPAAGDRAATASALPG
jgi:hypothetical protein